MSFSFLAVASYLLALVSGTFRNKIDADRTEISLYINENGSYSIQLGLDSNADIEAYFIDGMNSVGWGILEVKTNNISHKYQVSDKQLMYFAGVVEGYLTSSQIYQTWNNMRSDYANGPSAELKVFLQKQSDYETKMINDNPEDAFWKYTALLSAQLSGLWFGYNLTAKKNNVTEFNSSWPLLYLNLMGDMIDLNRALDLEFRKNLDYEYIDDYQTYRRLNADSHCSAIVKISPIFDNLFIGHSSWFTYKNTNRIFKHYIFNLIQLETASTHMMFSSYPGYLESLDDYYIMDSGLAMLQTTNSIPNTTVYDLVTPYSLFAWQRVRIANALSNNGYQWWKYVSRENSGTYNNQYMIINYGIFESEQPLPDGFLWVVEQMPGLVAGKDMTDVVERGYWASYNVPAIEEVYDKSGYPALVAKYGVEESYDLAPRARIFRRDANKISTVEEAYLFLRYNNYTSDAIENSDPMWAICSRGDLETPDGTPSGCYDTKVSNLSMILNMQAIAINGPTMIDNPPFNWKSFPLYDGLHDGIPDLMDWPAMWMQSELAVQK